MHTVYNGLDLVNLDKVLERDKQDFCLILEPITIGKNSFIGKRATILPGTTIGPNFIIGAGSVVKGNIPDDSIVIGNPGEIVKKTSDWIDNKITLI